MQYQHDYERRRVTWTYSSAPLPKHVADAIKQAADFQAPEGWEPDRLLVMGHGTHFTLCLDLAPEDSND